MLDKIKNHPICATVIAISAVYGTVAGLYLSLDSKYHELQNCRITDAEKYKTYQNQYNEVTLKCRELELNNVTFKKSYEDTISSYNKLKGYKWEEQFYAERVSCRALTEELELTKKRHNNEILELQKRNDDLYNNNIKLSTQINNSLYSNPKQISETVTSFDQLLKEKNNLNSEVRRLSLELEKKTQIIVALQDKLKVSEDAQLELKNLIKKNGIAVSGTNSSIDAVIASVQGISASSYATNAVVAGVGSIKGGVSGADFCRILKAANISSEYYIVLAIKDCAKFINTPIPPKDISDILGKISSSAYHSEAAQIIMSINAK